ncbi:MAG: T9SS type A sorting domain-containing protein, partial [Planctomycetia bacterium]|nr:T9SS type A sorting domain-containing protein [Planctomycetia bacterium]
MSGVLHSLVSVVRARHAKAAQARRPARTRLQVEALEERCLLAWGSLPPPTIAIPTSALAVDLDTQGTATIAGNEVDFYLLDVQSPATYIISAATPASNLDTVLALYDANGLRLAFNDDVSATNLDSSLNRFLQPGIYYFGITKLAGTPGGSYTWSVAEPTIPENNTLATATDLGVLTEPTFRSPLTLVGAAAWVRFTMNGPGTSTDRVAVQALAGADDLQLELTDALGVPLRESIGATNSEEISLDGLPAGTYHVRVYDNDGDADLAFYTLVINPGAAPVVIPLDASGAGTGADTIGLENTEDPFPDVVPIPDVVRFTATVTGRVSILMRADTPLMQSLLSDPSQVSAPASPVIVANQAAVAGQFEGTQDYLIQFDVVAGNTYQLNASVVKEPGQVPHVGDYRLFVSTEPLGSDFSAVTPHEVPLDASGTGLQLGTLETVGDIDLFTFTATVTGRTTVRIDGGAGVNQVVHLLTKPGQRYAVEVSDANDSTGVYALSITSIADDFPDSVVNRIALDAAGSGNVKGTINYAGDEDVFRFTATQTGTITVRMQSRPGIDTFSALISALSVTPIPTASYEISPSRPSTAGEPAFDRIVQFQVVQGEQ